MRDMRPTHIAQHTLRPTRVSTLHVVTINDVEKFAGSKPECRAWLALNGYDILRAASYAVGGEIIKIVAPR